MKNIELNVEQFYGTGCYERLKNIQLFYDYVSTLLESFSKEENIHCPHSCGECCKHYMPDLTVAEAEYIALFLMETNRVDEFYSRIERGVDYCPMYNEESNYHCSIYQARGLICRLFGSACSLDKKGEAKLPHCKWGDLGSSKTLSPKKDAPIASKLGMELENINGGAIETEPFNQAVSKAIMKLELIISYSGDRAQ